jgi:hypothetical protein
MRQSSGKRKISKPILSSVLESPPPEKVNRFSEKSPTKDIRINVFERKESYKATQSEISSMSVSDMEESPFMTNAINTNAQTNENSAKYINDTINDEKKSGILK